MAKILAVEDDKEINALLCSFLSDEGYDIISAFNGLDAVKMIREDESIDLVLLDLMLPFQSGDSVITKVREFSDVPFIVVSAKDTTRNKVELMRLGADDYITKPFDLDELLVRVEAVLRRSSAGRGMNSGRSELSYKSLILDTASCTARVCGKELTLTGKEYAILELMLKNPSKLFSKVNIFESVWNEPYFNDDNIIKVHMSNIRTKIKKLDPDSEYIETVWGMGYRLFK